MKFIVWLARREMNRMMDATSRYLQAVHNASPMPPWNVVTSIFSLTLIAFVIGSVLWGTFIGPNPVSNLITALLWGAFTCGPQDPGC